MSLKLRWELIVKSSHMTQICNLSSSAMTVWMLADSNNAFPTVTMGVHFHVPVPTVSGISVWQRLELWYQETKCSGEPLQDWQFELLERCVLLC